MWASTSVILFTLQKCPTVKLFGSSSHSYGKATPGQHSSLIIQISLPFPNKRLPVGSDSKESACNEGDTGLIHGSDPLEKGMATHSSILAWEIPWTEKPGGLQSMGLQGVGHDGVTNTHTHTHTPTSFPPAYTECGFPERSFKMTSTSHPSVYPFYLKTFPLWQMKRYF